MKNIITLLIFCINVLYTNSQGIKVSAGSDLFLNCFDEIQLNGIIISWTNKFTWEVGLKSICFVNDTIGYAAGGQWNKGIIIKTIDGGKTWDQLDCPANSFLNDILFINKDTGFVVGGNENYIEIILKTTDGGISWSFKSSPKDNKLNSIFFSSDSIGYATGDWGSLLKTINGGETWFELDVSAGHFKDICFLNDSVGLVVGEDGKMYKTINRGETWQIIENNIVFHLYSIVFVENACYVTGAEGLIMYSENLFETYSILQTGVLSDLHDIKVWNKDTFIIVGRQNTILVTYDGGKSWKKEYSDYDGDLYSSCSLNNGKKFAVGSMPFLLNDGCILYYNEIPSDLSISWTPAIYLSDPEILCPLITPQESISYILEISDTAGINISDTINVTVRTPGVFAGFDATINFNDTIQLHGLVEIGRWDLISNESRVWFNEVCFLNKDTGFIAGSQIAGTILKTTDGGETWQHKITNIDYSLNDLHFVNNSVGYVAGYKGTILKTTDCGESWNKLTSNSTEGFNSVCFINENIGFVAGSNGTILKTVNGGNSWQEQYSGTTLELKKIYFINESRGFATAIFAYECAFFETSDGGNYWKKDTIPDMILDFTDVFFVNNKVGYMIGGTLSPFGFIKTLDGGKTWQNYLFPRSSLVTYTSVFFTDEYTGYVSNGIGEILKTIDGGNTWYIWDTISGAINDLYFIDENNAYAVGDGGVMARYHAKELINYNWAPDYNIINKTSLHPFVFPHSSNTYYLEVYTEEGCYTFDDISIYVNKDNNIKRLKIYHDDIKIFPNPSTNYLIICFNNNIPETYQIKIYDNNGIIHYSNKIYSTNSGKYTYNHKLNPGVYYVEIKSQERKALRKFIVE